MATTLKHIPLDRIRHNPVALRSVDKETLDYQGLVDSVRNVGVLSAILVREITNENPDDPEPMYGIIDGLHRFSASQDSGQETIPCQITTMDDANVLEAQIIGNVQKIETKPVEYSKQLVRMIASNPALVSAEVAARLGKSPEWLNARLGLPRLLPEIQTLVDDGKITLTNALALSKLDGSIQANFVERAMTLSPTDFVPAAQAAKKEYESAKRQGRDPNADTFVHVPKLQKIAALNDELSSLAVGQSLISKYGVATPSEAWALALKWVMNSDTDSIASQRLKHEARIADSKKKRDDAKAEREKLAKERAANAQVEVQLAPGVPLKG